MPQRAGPLEDLVAPPFDVISPEEQSRYYARSPYNVIRLILGHQFAEDSTGDNRYTRARGFFAEWLQAGVLREEATPAYYLYQHHFTLPKQAPASRLGLVAAVRLAPFGSGVHPHERTMPHPKSDRLSLVQAVGVDLSPIFALFEDAATALLLREAAARATPVMTIRTDDGQRHELSAIATAGLAAGLQRALAPVALYIADGHHRYETALAYQAQERRQHPRASADAPFNFVMVLLVDAADPGLRILPTHRVVRRVAHWDARAFRAALAGKFRLLPVSWDELEALLSADAPASHRFGVCLGAQDFALLEAPARPSPGAGAAVVEELDVAVLHGRVLSPLLGIQPADEESEATLAYSRDAAWVAAEVASGRAQVAFLLRPPSVASVLAVARAGALMPHKSTFFFPKPLSGVLFHRLPPNGVVAPAS